MAFSLLKTWRCSASTAFWHVRNQFLKIYFNLYEATILYCGSLFQNRVSSCFSFFFPDVTESQEVLFDVFLLKCLFPSIHGWGCFVCCHHPWFRECVEIPTAWQLEVKRVATAVKAGCLLMSRPAEWMRTQMGFLSGGLFFWPSLSVVGDMGTSARIDWHLIEWGKT